MRLLHVHSGNLYGGVETLLVTLRRFADAASLEHEFALCFEGRIAAELRQLGAQLHNIGAVRTRHPLTVLRARRVLRDVLSARQFDTVVCHMPWAQALFGRVVRAAGFPLIFWMHDAATGNHWVERWARLTQPDLVLCNSNYTASTLPRLYPRARHEVLFYPIVIAGPRLKRAERIELRDEFATPDDAVVIVQASRFEPWKGHSDHLEALGHLVDLTGWICWIVGGAQRPVETRYLDRFKQRATELGLGGRMRFCGERSDVPQVLRAADIYCQPNSGAEPFGIVFAEALTAGLPIVTTALGGTAELINESCGLIVPPHDPTKLAERLRQLIVDATLRDRLGAAGIRRVTELCDPLQQIHRLGAIVENLTLRQ
jgi:glycosyltransferase involved in cell wall biosynthesis